MEIVDLGTQDLAQCSSERLDTFRVWVGVAALRSLEVDAVPEELQTEPLNRLFAFPSFNVLLFTTFYHQSSSLEFSIDCDRFRSKRLSTPLHFLMHFLCLRKSSCKEELESEEEEEILEQVALVLDIVKFHCGECA
jgi:hypothetical protein